MLPGNTPHGSLEENILVMARKKISKMMLPRNKEALKLSSKRHCHRESL